MAFKTVKIKVSMDSKAIDIYNRTCEELTWVWNKVRATALRNHTETWYKWAEKRTTSKIFGDYDLTGIIKAPIYIGDSAFIGARCMIATGGNYYKKDESVKIPYNHKKEIRYKHGYKLVAGDKPYTPIDIQEFSYLTLDKELTKITDLDSKKRLNTLRERDGLPPLTIHSDYIGGLIRKDFDTAWKAFLSPTLMERKKLRYKTDPVKTIVNTQTPPKISGDSFLLADKKQVKAVGKFQLLGTPKTYSLTKEPSGFYLCISCEYEPIIKQTKDITCGIDPGIKNIISTDHAAMFNPNYAREETEERIEKLQQKLARLVEINNVRLNRPKNKQKELRTNNEQKLIDKIARLHEKSRNSTKAFNHKLSTRIARTYRNVVWEDTKLKNLTKQVEARVSGEFDGYEPNGASAKAGLNNKFKVRSIGGLKDLVKRKVLDRDGSFEVVASNNTSQNCHGCGTKGNRVSQSLFLCVNKDCNLFDLPQNADVNAAKNIKKLSKVNLEVSRK
jgi:transposase